MSTQEPVDEFIKRVEAVEDSFRRMHDNIGLRWANDAIEDIGAQLRDLPASVQQLRTRGYVFKSFLERKSDVMAQQWTEIRPRIVESLDTQARELRYQADLFQQRLPSLRYNRNDVELSAAESALRDLESRAQSAGDVIRGMYDTLQDNVRQTAGQIKDIAWVLDQVDGATFKLYPGECVVSAVKAQWMTSEKEGPKGVLVLTDERVLFEQKEQVATKKVLFITTEKQTAQKLQWEAAWSQVEAAQASEKGGAILGIGKKEILEFRFAGSVKVRSALLRLEDDSDAWQALVGRIKSGDIANERATPKDKAAVQAARAAPTKCAVCGATITQPVVKGMTEIKCEYCGAVTRL